MQSQWNSSQFLVRIQNVCLPTLENSVAVSLKLNTHLLYNPAILLLCIYPNETNTYIQYKSVYSRFIHNNQKLEITQMSFN